MPDDTNRRETGVRKYPADRRPDPSDEFSQDAAENEKPRDGMGLTEPVDRPRRPERRIGNRPGIGKSDQDR